MEIESVDIQAAPVDDHVMVYLGGMWGASMNPTQGDPESSIQGCGDDYRRARALVADLDGPGWDAYLRARGTGSPTRASCESSSTG